MTDSLSKKSDQAKPRPKTASPSKAPTKITDRAKSAKLTYGDDDAKTHAKITGPTILTILRMFLAVAFFILVLIPTLPTHIIALIVFIAGAISDLIDGKWARRRQKVTDLGAFLDPLADKMLVSLAFLALVFMQIIPIWVFAIILVRDFAIDGMRMMAAREGITIAASWSGKWKTTLQLTTLIIFLSNLILAWPVLDIIGNIFLYLSLLLTIYSGAEYLIRNWKKVIK